MILVWNDQMKDPVWSKIVHIEVHTQLHSATRVFLSLLHYSFSVTNLDLHLPQVCDIELT